MKSNYLLTAAIVLFAAGPSIAEEVNPFLGKVTSISKPTAADKTAASNPLGKKTPPPPMPMPVPLPPAVSQSPLPSKQTQWKVIGRVGQSVILAEGATGTTVIHVKDGDPWDGCLVKYPAINCDTQRNVDVLSAQIKATEKKLATTVASQTAAVATAKKVTAHADDLQRTVDLQRKRLEELERQLKLTQQKPSWVKGPASKVNLPGVGVVDSFKAGDGVVILSIPVEQEVPVDKILNGAIEFKEKAGTSVYYRVWTKKAGKEVSK